MFGETLVRLEQQQALLSQQQDEQQRLLRQLVDCPSSPDSSVSSPVPDADAAFRILMNSLQSTPLSERPQKIRRLVREAFPSDKEVLLEVADACAAEYLYYPPSPDALREAQPVEQADGSLHLADCSDQTDIDRLYLDFLSSPSLSMGAPHSSSDLLDSI